MIERFDPAYLAHEYRLARLRMTDLIHEQTTDVADLPVPTCPDWTVHDLVAHVAGIATSIVKGNPPGGDSQAWVDTLVEERRDHTLEDLLGEWSLYGPPFEEMAAATRKLAVPLSYDTVVHEHDLRHAIGRPGARDTSGVLAAMEVGVWLMSNDLDRRGFGRVAFRAGGRDWLCGSGETRLSLDLDAENLAVPPIWELLRLTGSRRSLQQVTRLSWNGDFDEGFSALLHMDLPAVVIDG